MTSKTKLLGMIALSITTSITMLGIGYVMTKDQSFLDVRLKADDPSYQLDESCLSGMSLVAKSGYSSVRLGAIEGVTASSSTLTFPAGSSVGNLDAIRGIKSITITVEEEEEKANFDLYLGYDFGVLYNAGSMSSLNETSLPSSPYARYFKLVNTSASEITLDDFDITYTCEADDAEQRLAKYTPTAGVITSAIDGGAAFSSFRDDEAPSLSIGSTLGSVRTLKLKGNIEYAKSFKTSATGLMTVDLSEYTGSLTSWSNDSKIACADGAAIILPTTIKSFNNSMMTGSGRKVYIDATYAVNGDFNPGTGNGVEAVYYLDDPEVVEADSVGLWTRNVFGEPSIVKEPA